VHDIQNKSGNRILWWRAGTCRSGGTKPILRMTSNVFLIQLTWFSTWLKTCTNTRVVL